MEQHEPAAQADEQGRGDGRSAGVVPSSSSVAIGANGTNGANGSPVPRLQRSGGLTSDDRFRAGRLAGLTMGGAIWFGVAGGC